MPHHFRLRRMALSACLLAATAAAPLAAQAALQARDANGDASPDAYYDSTLDITWLRNANAGAGSAQDDGASTSDGLMTHGAAQAWVAALSVGGVGGWRLPTTGACSGFGCSGATSELGTMFYANLGGQVAQPISASHNAAFALFSGVADVGYWSGETSPLDPDQAGVHFFGEGFQDTAFKDFSENAAWAVHAGDVFAVPEPGTWALTLAGLGLLGWRRTRRRVAA